MANTAQAKKRARQAEKHRQANASKRSEMRTFLKKTLKAISSDSKETAAADYKTTSSILDKLARKGLIAKNKAARHKSRLNAKLKTM